MVSTLFVFIAFILFAGRIYLIIRGAMKGSENIPKNKKKKWEPK